MTKRGKIKVSDHAIIRYLERVENLDRNKVVDEILTDEFLTLFNSREFKEISDLILPCKDTHSAVVRTDGNGNSTIITVYSHNYAGDKKLAPAKAIRLLLYKSGISVSLKEINHMVREYNEYEMPVTERLEQIIDDPENFINYVKENVNGEKI